MSGGLNPAGRSDLQGRSEREVRGMRGEEGKGIEITKKCESEGSAPANS